jgi:hypothetical protein
MNEYKGVIMIGLSSGLRPQLIKLDLPSCKGRTIEKRAGIREVCRILLLQGPTVTLAGRLGYVCLISGELYFYVHSGNAISS